MANGGIRRFLAASAGVLSAALSANAPTPVSLLQRYERHDIYLGRWSYQRKGKRTAAQIQRAARKKRNRARNK